MSEPIWVVTRGDRAILDLLPPGAKTVDAHDGLRVLAMKKGGEHGIWRPCGLRGVVRAKPDDRAPPEPRGSFFAQLTADERLLVELEGVGFPASVQLGFWALDEEAHPAFAARVHACPPQSID